MQMDLTYFPGQNAVGVVDFNGTGEAAMKITINGVDYQEADAADPEDGVWTNGASAANSATSFAAAVNGDTRENAPPHHGGCFHGRGQRVPDRRRAWHGV